MVKQHSQLINFALGLCDQTIVASAWSAAYAFRFTFFPSDKGMPPLRDVITNLAVVMLVSLVVLAGTGLYKPRRDKSFLLELGQILKAGILIWVMLIVLIYYSSEVPFTRGMLASFLPFLLAGLILERGAFRSLLRFLRRRGWNLRHALIVGTGRLGQSTLHRLQHNTWTGIRVAGFIAAPHQLLEAPLAPSPPLAPSTPLAPELAPGSNASTAQSPPNLAPAPPIESPLPLSIRNIPVLGTTADLQKIVESKAVDCVFVALPSHRGELLRRVIADLEKTSVDVRIIPDLFLSRFPTNVGVSELDGLPIISLRENPLAGWPSIYKRLFDIAGSLFGLLLLALPMLLIAALIKLHDQGPVFYKQRRMSYGRRAFNMLKFRTMITTAESAGPEFAKKDDPRTTPLGKWLRSTSLNELPQLFNVLVGDMSLVGPRPERPEMLEKIQQEVPGFPLRLKVRAGLTGWAQINGFRGRSSFKKRLQYDLYYLNNWSPLLNLRIVLTTLLHLRHPNAY